MTRFIAAALAAIGILAFTAAGAGSKPPDIARADAQLPFLANAGQMDPRVAFYARTFAGTVFATHAGEIVYSLPARDGAWVLNESFVDGNAKPSGGARSATRVSVLALSRSVADVTAVDSVRFGEVWPGVEVEVHARGSNIEKIFTLAPGTDDDVIEVAIDGATLSVAPDGSLVATTGEGPVSFAAPVAFQEGPAGREPVPVRYRLDGHRYGFELGDYDRTRPVVIDPIIQSTYIGGAGSTFLQEGPRDIAVHPVNGDVYVAGATDSMDLPGVAGGAVPALAGSASGFIARFNADLTTLHQATFFGGNADEWISSILVTASDVYVSGYTAASTLPAGTTAGAQPTDPNPGADFNGFIARLPLTLTSVTASTFLGGTTNHFTQIHESMLHPNGDLYVCGRTASGSLPNTAGRFDAANAAGDRTAFVTRVAPDLTSFVQTTYFTDGGFSGTGTQCNAMVALSGSSDIVIGGTTEFGSFPPPNTAGGLVTTSTGSWLARLDETLTQNLQSTWLAGVASGTGTPGVYGLRVHPTNGDLYVVTQARMDSPQPADATIGGGQPTCTGTFMCLLVLRVSPSLTSLVAGTFYGNPAGAIVPRAYDHLAIDPASGDVFIASDGAPSLPDTAGGIQPVPINTGGTPGMAVRIRGDLGQIVQATYLSAADTSGTSPYAAVVHQAAGQLYVAGYTGPAFPQTSGGAQPAIGSPGGDGFVSRMTLDLLGASSPGVLQVSPATYAVEEGDTVVQVSVTRTGGTDGAASVSYATSDGTATAGADYTATTGTLNWAAGDGATKTIGIPVLEDTDVESAETITLTLSNATGAMLGTPAAATITINDDDVAPVPQPGVVQFASASYSVDENGGSVTLTLTRTNGADGAICVSVASGGGSASAGSDYTALTQTVNWAAGDATDKTVMLTVANDTADESSETVTVTLSNPTGGATLGATASTTVTIVDDDDPVMPPPPPPASNTQTRGSYGGGGFEWCSLLVLAALALRRRLWLLVGGLVASVPIANAAEPVSGIYVGVRGGISQSSLDSGDIERRLVNAGFDMDVSSDDRDSTWGVFGGYRWANGLGIEAGFLDLGEFDVAMEGETSDPDGLLPVAADVLGDAGYAGALTLGWQWVVTDSFAVTPRIGVYYWESENELSNDGGQVRIEDSGTEITGGLALSWRLNRSWAIGLQWDAYDAGDHHDLHTWTASVEYTFGGR